MVIIDVHLTHKNYQIRIQSGLYHICAEQIAQVWTPRQIALITDTNVAPLYLETVESQLIQAGYQVTPIIIPAGETSKSLDQAMALYSQLAAANLTRHDGVIALGGGVVGDLAGFIASTYMRGIAFIQMPTSLLAQVDSSVGGKTALDLPAGKNLVGSFYQPDLVLIDPDFLTSLDQRQLLAGYAEVVKVAALNGGTFWQQVTGIQSAHTILAQAETLIQQSVHYKAQIVMADEKESNQRQLLNYGHTIGHAVETLANGSLMHGEAVSIGLVAMQHLVEQSGLTEAHLTPVITNILNAVGLPTDSPLLMSDRLFTQLLHDKKNQGDAINLVYLDAIGVPKIQSVPLTTLAANLFSKKTGNQPTDTLQ